MGGRLLKVLGITLVVPVVGLIVSTLVLNSWDAEAAAQGVGSLAQVCASPGDYEGEEAVCGERLPVFLLQQLSLVAAVIPLAIIGIQLLAAQWAGRRRAAMAAVFPVITGLTIIGLLVMVLAQTVVAIGALWYGESALIGSVHVGIMVTLGIGALVAAWALARSVLDMARRPIVFAVGKTLTADEAPSLFEHVGRLASKLGAPAPRQIVVGMQPTFYVTHGDVQVYGRERPLQGATLYLSAPLSRLLTRGELDAVIGHELGHFRGEDTAYSLKFAPVYTGIGSAVDGMLDDEGRVSWMALPALHMLGLLHDVFATNEAAVSRERELEADRAGTEVSSHEAQGLALLKISLHAEAFEDAMQDPRFAFAPADGGDYSRGFAERVRSGFDAARWQGEIEPLLTQRTTHPIDTHPPVGERLEALGFSVDGLDPRRLLPPESGSGAEVIDNLAALEQELTRIEHEFRERLGALPMQG